LSDSFDFGPQAIGFSPPPRLLGTSAFQRVEIEIRFEQVLADSELTSVFLPGRI
jgi:hypothetical protein